MRNGEIAEFAVGVDDWSFVSGDGVGSVLERGADVIDGGLAGFDVERGGLEYERRPGRPSASLGRSLTSDQMSRPSAAKCPLHAGRGIETIWVGDPSQTASCDSRDAERNSVAVAKFVLTISQQFHERTVYVAEAEKAEVVGVNVRSPPLRRY